MSNYSAIDNLVDSMRSAHFVVSIWSGKPDAKIICETGAAVLLDKPIIIVRLKGCAVPEKLRLIATEIVDADEYDGVAAKGVKEALNRMVKQIEKKKRMLEARN